MTTGFFQFFNSKAQSNSSKKARSGRDRSPLKPRRLLTEALEERQLLAVDAFGASSALATYATPNIINITSADYSIDAIKGAIEAAAATPEDEIIRIPTGTLTFSSPSDTIMVDYNADVYGKIAIVAVGGDVTINANSQGRAFTIKNGNVTLESINITGGSADYGGAIANAGVLTLKNVELTNNKASNFGGAIANKGVLAVQSSVMTQNTATQGGAAVYDGDFAWPSVSAPEWIAQIPDQVGEKDATINLDLSQYCSEGNWTYGFTCSNPNADIFSVAPSISNGVLTMSFIGNSAYRDDLDLSGVEFTVTASDGATTVSQTFKASHKDQAAIKISAILSNKSYDDVYDVYAITHKQGKKEILDGFAADTIPPSEVVDLAAENLYIQVWTSDLCYDDGESELAWNAGDNFYTIGYVVTLQLTNATVTNTFPAATFVRDSYKCEDHGNGKYVIKPAYPTGAPFGYNDALLLDMLEIQVIDPSKPVSVEVSQYTTDPSKPSASRMYEDPDTGAKTPTFPDPSQILYSGCVSTSTEPYAAHMGLPYADSSGAVGEFILNTSQSGITSTISNSLIADNNSSGSGAVYVASDGVTCIYNSTIANNAVADAAVYINGSATVANSIVVNASAPFFGNVAGTNNLINATKEGSVTYEASKPLFAEGYALAVGSQAANIGSADYALAVDGSVLTTDLAGAPRFSAAVDAGAYEYQGSAPVVPGELTVSDYVDSAKNPTLTWTASTATDGVDGYYVYSGAAVIATVTETSLANLASYVTLADNSSYTFGVAAFNVYGVSAKRTVTLDTTVAPAAPTGLAFGDYANGSATLTWQAVSNAASYVVTVKNDATGQSTTHDVNETSYTLTGLSDFASYSCTVTAVNSRGTAVSEAVTLNTTVAPATPTGLAASAYTGDGSTTLTWNTVENAAGYKIAKKVGDAWVAVDSTTNATFKVEGLADNSTYVFGVASYAVRDGAELVSEYAEVSVVTTVAPNAPTGLTWVGDYADHSATLQWTASDGAVGYRVAAYQNGSWTVLGETTNLQYVLSDLANNQVLTFGVAAYSELGANKLYSDYAAIELNTVVAPAAATNVRFTEYTGGATANLTWSASIGGATGYRVEQLVNENWVLVAATPDTTYAVAVQENSFYTYRVVAFNEVAGVAAVAAPSAAANLDTLVAPQGDITVVVSGYDYTTDSATLTWTNLQHASYYVVEQKLAGEADFSIIASNVPAGTNTTTSYGLAGLQRHTTYQFRVIAHNAKGAGSVGLSDEFYTAAPPAAPTASYAYDSESGTITLTYSSAHANSYVVKDESGAVLYEGPNGSYSASGFAENETYIFTITASNEVGSSAATTVSVHTAAVPQVPTGLVAGAYANGSVTLSWNDVEAETGYRVYMRQGGEWGVVADLAANTTEYTATGLSNYAIYQYCVTAYNDLGESAKSSDVTVNTAVAPAAPTGLGFTFGESTTYQGDGKATLTWNAVANASGYQIQQKVEGVWTNITTTALTSYDIVGLANYTTYDYRVAAYAMRGEERLTSGYTGISLNTAWVPTAELTLNVSAYDSASKSAKLTWNAVQAATAYKVEQFVNGVWTSVGTTGATSYTLALADNTNYAFRVVATNAIGDGSSDVVEFFTAAAPGAPTVAAHYDSVSGSATITFNSAFATTYTVKDEAGALLYTGSATSFVHDNLAENTTYKYVVVASNDLGDSSATTYSLYTAAVPAAPTGLRFDAYANNAAYMHWNAVDGANGYRVYLQTGAGWQKIGDDLSAETNLIRLTELEDFNKYTFCVTAFNDQGESAYSETATLETTLTPAAPTVTVTFGEHATYQGDGKATLTWNAVNHAEGYYVAQKIGGNWTFLTKTSDLSYAVSGMQNFNLYEFGVASYATLYGEDLVSDFTSVSIDTTWVPEGDLSLTIGAYNYVANTAQANWTAVVNANGYRVDVIDANDNLVSSWTTANTNYAVTLSDNAAFTVRVTAFNAVGDGSSDAVEIFTFAPPAAPSDAEFGEFVVETGKSTITWTAVAFAEWYEVKTTIGGGDVVKQTDVPYYTVEGLVEDMEYTYYVRACNHIGDTAEEGYSEWVEVTLDTHPAAPPKAPSGFAVVDYDEATLSARLIWKDNSRNEDNFIIQRSLDGQMWVDVAYPGTNEVSCAISNLNRGTTYNYRIAAANQYGQSEWVSIEYAVPSGAPVAPSNVAFGVYDAINKVLEVSWTDNSTNELYFMVERSLDGETWGGAHKVSANVTSLELLNLTEGKNYQFRVSAWNNFGGSEYAYGSYQIPVDGKVTPAAPSGLVFGAFDYALRKVQMSWTDMSVGESDAADVFVIEYSFDGQTWRSAGTTNGNVTTRTATGMIVGRDYYFRVCARNAAGDSGWATATFNAELTVATPQGFVIGDYSDGALEMSWTYGGTLSENGGFIVQYSFDGANWSRAGHTAYNVNELVATDVAPNRTYYFRVAAYDGAIYSDWLYSDAYTSPSGAPSAPSDLTFSNFENNSVQLSWTDNSRTEVGFNVQYSIDGGVTWVSSGNTNKDVTTKTALQLRSGVTYQFRVRAYNYFGASEWTTGEFEVPRSVSAPNAPTDFTIGAYDAAAKTLAMSWVDNSNNETGFRVQYRHNANDQWYAAENTKSNVTSRTATGLVTGRTYQFRVCAYNADGASDWVYSEEFYVSGVSGAVFADEEDDLFETLSNNLLDNEAVDSFFINYFEEEF
jgi:hypothetical protein